jgi:hypothetical protein
MAHEPPGAENPFQSPRSDTTFVGERTASLVNLYQIARNQKVVLLTLAVQIFGFIIQTLIDNAAPPPVSMLLGVGILVTILVAAVFVFRLASLVYSTAAGVVCALLTVIPCIGLITLFVVNSRATAVLRQNGIRIGFFGADLAQLRPAEE